MGRPRSKQALEAEVETWTEDVSGRALLEMLAAALTRPVRISREFDVPYLAGYSRDGRIIYIDRHLPKTLKWRGRRHGIDRFIALHEIVEKSLLDELRLHYLHAHQIALRTEQAAVRAAGIPWRVYDRFTKANSKKIEKEKLTRVPAALDLVPYSDEEDYETLRQLVAKGA
jgi:hypothetical protein